MHPHTATFSEPVWTFGVDDISLATGGEVVNLVPLSPPHTRFAFEVAGALDGPQGLRVRPATVSDAAGNGNVGSQWFGGHIIYDTAPPRPTITSASPHLSNRNFTVTGTAQLSSHPLQPPLPSSHPALLLAPPHSPGGFAVTFSEEVTDVQASDITVSSGTVTGLRRITAFANFSDDALVSALLLTDDSDALSARPLSEAFPVPYDWEMPSSFAFVLVGAEDGEPIVSVGPGAAVDIAGNLNSAGATWRGHMYDTTPPLVWLESEQTRRSNGDDVLHVTGERLVCTMSTASPHSPHTHERSPCSRLL